MKTTLNKIRACGPCRGGWEKLLRYLGKTKADDEPISVLTILQANGFDDALWCLRAVEGHNREIRLYAVWCARQVQHLMADPRSLTALDVAERFAHGLASVEELNAAGAAAWGVVWDAAVALARASARAAAWVASGVAAWDAAVASARNASRAAAWAASGDAAGAAARNAAQAAARASQEAELVRMCREIDRSQHERN